MEKVYDRIEPTSFGSWSLHFTAELFGHMHFVSLYVLKFIVEFQQQIARWWHGPARSILYGKGTL